MVYGFIVFVHITYPLKIFHGAGSDLAKQFDKLERVLRKTVQFRTVAGRNNHKAIYSFFFGTHMELVNTGVTEAEYSTDIGIGLFITQTNCIEGIMFGYVIFLHVPIYLTMQM
jgi:hypothetical protein